MNWSAWMATANLSSAPACDHHPPFELTTDRLFCRGRPGMGMGLNARRVRSAGGAAGMHTGRRRVGMRWTGLAVLVVTLATTSAFAGPGDFPQCCACRIVQWESGPAYVFVQALNNDDLMSFGNQCSDVQGHPTCLVSGNPDCSAFYAELGTTCGPVAPVPLLGPSVLAGLALALAGLGAWAVRNRSATRHPH